MLDVNLDDGMLDGVAVVADLADNILVMKDGLAVESGTVIDVFTKPQHPYTKSLLAAVPHLGTASAQVNEQEPANAIVVLRVLPDGTIAVPLLGQITAAGLTVKQLRDKLSKGLEKYIAQNSEMPTLTVAVDEFQGYSVSVLGEVNQPGHYQPGHYVTVLEALALARGLTPYARGERIVILRRGAGSDGKQRRIPISYPKLSAGQRPEMNLFLLRGDVVVVP